MLLAMTKSENLKHILLSIECVYWQQFQSGFYLDDYKVAFESLLKASRYGAEAVSGANGVRLAIESLYDHFANMLVNSYSCSHDSDSCSVELYASQFDSKGGQWPNPFENMNSGKYTFSSISEAFDELASDIPLDFEHDKAVLALLFINQIVQKEVVGSNISYHVNHKDGAFGMRREGCSGLLEALDNCYSEVTTPRCVLSGQFHNLLCMSPFHLPVLDKQYFAVEHLYGILKGALTGEPVELECQAPKPCSTVKAGFDDMHKISALIKESAREIASNGLLINVGKGDSVRLTPGECGNLLCVLSNVNENVHFIAESHKESMMDVLRYEEASLGMSAWT